MCPAIELYSKTHLRNNKVNTNAEMIDIGIRKIGQCQIWKHLHYKTSVNCFKVCISGS